MTQWERTIRIALDLKDMSMTKFSQLMGMSRPSIYGFVRKKVYTKQKLRKAAHILGVDVMKLLELDYRNK